jgi:hypothetical protein
VAGGDDVAGREGGRRAGPRVQLVRGHRLVLAGPGQRHRGGLYPLHGEGEGEAFSRGGRPRLRLQQLRALGPRALGPLPDLRARQVPGPSVDHPPFTHLLLSTRHACVMYPESIHTTVRN